MFEFSCSSYFNPFKISGNIRMMALKVKCHIDWEEKKKKWQPKQFYQKASSSGLITGVIWSNAWYQKVKANFMVAAIGNFQFMKPTTWRYNNWNLIHRNYKWFHLVLPRHSSYLHRFSFMESLMSNNCC